MSTLLSKQLGKKQPKNQLKFFSPRHSIKQEPLTTEMKSFIDKELTNSFSTQSLSIRPDNLLEHLDSSLEGFFHNRPYSLDNFNLLLKMLAYKGDINKSLDLLDKMQLLDLNPNTKTYNYLIVAAGRAKRLDLALVFFNQTIKHKKYSAPSLYTALISAYSVNSDHSSVERLIREKKENGMELLAIDYTCYINSLIRAKQFFKALETYKMAKCEVDVDEYLITMGIHACTKTNDSEYALTQWDFLQTVGFTHAAYHYNEIIMALAKRKDYAERGLQFYRQLRGLGITPDSRTFNAGLTACSRLGDIYIANELLTDMKQYGIGMDTSKYSLLFATYSEACVNKREKIKDVYIQDAWKLFAQCAEKEMVDTIILNGILSVHTKAYRNHDVEGLVLPLFSQYGIALDKCSYRHLIVMYSKLNDKALVNKLWEEMLEKRVEFDIYILNAVLDNYLKSHDTDRVVEVLAKFKEKELRPLYCYLKRMFDAKDLPMRVWAILQDFEYYYKDNVNKKFSKKLRVDSIENKFTQ